jgi:group I intron endonuclease
MTCGIYCITNTKNGKKYVGSSINIEYRFKQHKKDLRGHYHGNDHLQKAIGKYGIDEFEFSIIEECEKDKLLENEDKYINKFNSMNSIFGYNKKSADRTILSEETIQKIKDSHNTPEYKKWLTKNANENVWGNKEVKDRLIKNQWVSMHTDEHRELKSKQRQDAWDSNPEIKKDFSKKFKEKWDNEESPNRNKSFNDWLGSDRQKEIMSEKTQARWDDPIEREKMITARKEFGSKKEFKNKISEISTERWADPEFKKQMSEQKKEKWADPKFKKMMKQSRTKNILEPIKCKVCQKLFVRKIHNQTICSKECKYIDKNKKRNKKKDSVRV